MQSDVKGGKPRRARPLEGKGKPEWVKFNTTNGVPRRETPTTGVAAPACTRNRGGKGTPRCDASEATRLTPSRAQLLTTNGTPRYVRSTADREGGTKLPSEDSDGLERVELLGGSKEPGVTRSDIGKAISRHGDPLNSNNGPSSEQPSVGVKDSSLVVPRMAGAKPSWARVLGDNKIPRDATFNATGAELSCAWPRSNESESR